MCRQQRTTRIVLDEPAFLIGTSRTCSVSRSQFGTLSHSHPQFIPPLSSSHPHFLSSLNKLAIDVMESAFNSNSLWDLSLPPSLPALADDDFIALLQKQFGGNIPGLEANKQSSQAANINPQNLSRVPIPKPVESPPSDDSPSPPSATDATSSRSRRQSGVNFEVGSSSFSNDLGDDEDSTLKRKASEEDLDDEPNPKSQHTCTYSTLSAQNT